MSQASRGLDETIARLERYCRTHQWAGFDPYDALNSELFARTPLAKSHVARLALTQILKRSPVNLRPLLRVAPQQEPKAIALFLTALSETGSARRRGESFTGDSLGPAVARAPIN